MLYHTYYSIRPCLKRQIYMLSLLPIILMMALSSTANFTTRLKMTYMRTTDPPRMRAMTTTWTLDVTPRLGVPSGRETALFQHSSGSPTPRIRTSAIHDYPSRFSSSCYIRVDASVPAQVSSLTSRTWKHLSGTNLGRNSNACTLDIGQRRLG
ncbi:hypothetical protein OH76DRAFT_835788 [Lentinus brumalis]|uniref:Uncharacterized protein n=1 Tax=Lentinus brumalis TaxID=2498619 RepID=A0A371D232_9APHY|nr:hypothetical protein OH76DRAFT_835788 [Polyporus brumalis]